MRTFFRFVKLVVTFISVILFIGIVGLSITYFYFAHDLPKLRSFEDYKPPIVSEVFSDNGEKMGEFWIERRIKAKIDEIPRVIIQAFVAAEDSRFFEHKGVDVRGIGRAFWENLKAGQVVQGGSTITQQITRSILLTKERSYERKIKEAILATRIDRTLSKKDILEIYFNQIFLGNRSYGVRAAVENYFHKDLDKITLAEAALIAGLTHAPTTDNPVINPKAAKERQLYVLARMKDIDYITKKEMETAAKETIKIYEAFIDKDFNNKYAPYFTEHIRRELLERYGDKLVYEGGLKVYTTGNIAMNKAAQKAVRHGLEALDHRRGYRGPVGHISEDHIPSFLSGQHRQALAEANKLVIHIPETEEDVLSKSAPTPLIDDRIYEAVVSGFSEDGRSIEVNVGNNTALIAPQNYSWVAGYFGGKPSSKLIKGDVIHIKKTDKDGFYELAQKPKVQGALFSLEPFTGYVKAMCGGYDFKDSEFDRSTQALRQPGSSFKPIIYSAALDKGYTYSSTILDAPIVYRFGTEVWAPKNYGGNFSGNTTFESDLIYSRNVPTVKIAHSIGTHYITAFARKLGLTNHFFKYLSMALGANSVYLSEMTTMAATIASYGKKIDRIYILKIEDSDGKVIYEYVPPKEVPEVAEAFLHAQNTDPQNTELNTELFEANKKWIEKDELKLSDEELRILYGKAIPNGYVVTPQTAYLMMNLMREVVKRGTGARVMALGKPAAGKTGTTNDETDAWFIGYLPDLAAGAWVGHDVKRTIGRGEQGGRTAAPIFIEYMQEAAKDLPPKEFEPPQGFSAAQIATLKGGSAIYSTGLSTKEAGGAWFGVSRTVQDRAVDFFEEDMGF